MLLIGVAAAACGGDQTGRSARESCERSVEINCSNAYVCLEAQEREELGFPPTEQDCVDELSAACAEEADEDYCPEGESYDPASARECIEQTAGASCDEIFSGSEEDYAPACSEICRP